jgi:hypothetical protein
MESPDIDMPSSYGPHNEEHGQREEAQCLKVHGRHLLGVLKLKRRT